MPLVLFHLQDAPEMGCSSSSSSSAPPVRYKLGDFGQATRLDLRTPVALSEGDSRCGGVLPVTIAIELFGILNA